MPRTHILLAALGMISYSSCGMLEPAPAAGVQTVDQREQRLPIPELRPETEGAEIAEQLDVRMVCTPRLPTRQQGTFTTSISEVSKLLIVNDVRSYRVETVVIDYLDSDFLRFEVQCTNASTGTVRFAEAAVVVQVDGQMANLDQAAFRDLQKVIVPPQATVSFTVPGPRLDTIRDGSKVTVGVYDAKVAGGDASFAFHYLATVTQQPVQMTRQVEEVDMNPQQLTELQRRLAGDQARFAELQRRIGSQGPVQIR